MEGTDGKQETEAARAAVGALRARAAVDLISPAALLAEVAVRFAIA